ncbi:hypothetical protein B1M_17125 [Burkholderia sp. TJI49]|nr:hypothetical protein B1M_17125 [Burkholderia sp. TJI49]
MTGDRARDLVAAGRHRQAFGKRDRRNRVRGDGRARRTLAARRARFVDLYARTDAWFTTGD